jgi:hypothetical protein
VILRVGAGYGGGWEREKKVARESDGEGRHFMSGGWNHGTSSERTSKEFLGATVWKVAESRGEGERYLGRLLRAHLTDLFEHDVFLLPTQRLNP